MSLVYHMGIDPGGSGASVLLGRNQILAVFRHKDKTGAEYKNWMKSQLSARVPILAVIEQVHSMPKQGVASSFKFGMMYGHALGMLDALEIPYQLVTPQRWQKDMRCRTGGDKNITKTLAHRIWPNYKATHADADALLLALWLSKFGT